MIPLLRVMVAALLAAQAAPADPLIAENAIANVSEHVHVISDRREAFADPTNATSSNAYTFA